MARTIPNTCPSCGKRPYPYGRPCTQCGFHGMDRERLSPLARSLGYIFLACLGLAVLAFIGMLFWLDSQFPV